MDTATKKKFEKIEVDNLATEEEITKQIEQVLAKKKELFRQMNNEVDIYRGQLYRTGSGVGAYGPHYDRLEEEVLDLDNYLNKLIRKLSAVAGKDAHATQKYSKWLKKG